MARKLSMTFLATIVIATLIRSTAAQTTHTVGDALGWVIPPGGAAAYSSWAANQTFSVGDTLVFNFVNNQHDATKVNKADYDACTTTNPIMRATTSPARITINGAGEHYFICSFSGHCVAGQKLMINVSAASSAPTPQPSSPTPQPFSVPAPQPTTPTPISAASPTPISSVPTPQPSTPTLVSAPSPAPVSTPPLTPISAPSPTPTRQAITYTVGDNQGWTLTANTTELYQNWVSDKNFMPGDILVFNYSSGAHDVAEVSKDDFDSCNTANPISTNNTPPTRITLTTGEHYYVCAIPGHCSAGQKLAINVGSASSPATPPGTSPSPTTPSSPSPSGSIAPPPPDSSATSLGVAALFATFLSMIVAFLF